MKSTIAPRKKEMANSIIAVLVMTGIEILLLSLSFFAFKEVLLLKLVFLAFSAISFAGIALCQVWGRIVSIIYHILANLLICVNFFVMVFDSSIDLRGIPGLFSIIIFGIPVAWGIIIILLLTVNRSSRIYFNRNVDIKSLEESIELV